MQAKDVKAIFFSARNISVMGFMSALSVVLYLFAKFNLPFFPPWLDIQFSDLPIVMAGFIVHPLATIVVSIVRFLIKLPFSSTFAVGEVADLIIGIAFALPASIIFWRNKTRNSAFLGLTIGAGIALLISAILNIVLLVPFYVELFFKGDFSKIVGVLSALYPSITADNFYAYYISLGVIPFNLMRLLLCAVFTFFVYKYLERALNSVFHTKGSSIDNSTDIEDNSDSQVME